MTKPFRFGVQHWAPVPALQWRNLAREVESLGYDVLSESPLAFKWLHAQLVTIER